MQELLEEDVKNDLLPNEDMSLGAHNLEIGKRGEVAASEFLRRAGYKIIDKNWKCPFGEADIIAIDDDDLVFIEVKTRSSMQQGFPCEAVTSKKRAKYEKIALAFLSKNNYQNMSVRFDVIDVIRIDSQRAFIRHHVNAFGVV